MRTVEDSGARGTDQCSVVPCHLLQGRAVLFRAVRCGAVRCDFLAIIFCSRSPYFHSVCELVNMSWSTMRVGQHELVNDVSWSTLMHGQGPDVGPSEDDLLKHLSNR
jgi:hypothetical protein